MKFKIGDRVNSQGLPDTEDWIGTIVKINNSLAYPYAVSFDEDPDTYFDWPMLEEELILVE